MAQVGGRGGEEFQKYGKKKPSYVPRRAGVAGSARSKKVGRGWNTRGRGINGGVMVLLKEKRDGSKNAAEACQLVKRCNRLRQVGIGVIMDSRSVRGENEMMGKNGGPKCF